MSRSTTAKEGTAMKLVLIILAVILTLAGLAWLAEKVLAD